MGWGVYISLGNLFETLVGYIARETPMYFGAISSKAKVTGTRFKLKNSDSGLKFVCNSVSAEPGAFADFLFQKFPGGTNQ